MTASKKHKSLPSRRRCNGQGIVEGTVAIVILAGFVVGGVLLILGTANAGLYASRISCAAEAGARYATESSEWMGMRRPGYEDDAKLASQVQEVVNTTLNQMGLPAGTVQVSRHTVGARRYLTVQVAVQHLGIVSGGILPAFINMTSSASSAYSDMTPPSVLGMTFEASSVPDAAGMGASMYLPAYGPGYNTKGEKVYIAGKMNYYSVGINESVTTFKGPRVIENKPLEDNPVK